MVCPTGCARYYRVFVSRQWGLFFDNSVKAVTITGASLRQYGQAILSLEIWGKIFHYAPTVSDISEDGIIGARIFAIL